MNASKEDGRRTRQNAMTEDNDRGIRTTEAHDRTNLHKQNRTLTYRMPNEDYKAHGKRMAQGNDRMKL